MKAAYLSGPGRLALADMDSDGKEALLAVEACGVCHSDRKALVKPPRGLELPRILGHELVGTLLRDLASSGLQHGDRVVVWPAISCGKCPYCREGRENLCGSIRLFGYHLDGGFAEQVYLPRELIDSVRLLKIPPGLSAATATFCEPLACVVNGFSKLMLVPQRCLVVGAGLMGRLAARVAASSGAEVLFHDIDQRRLDLALVDGKVFDGQRADVVFIAASAEGAVQFGLENLAPGGTILLFSGQAGDLRLDMVHNEIHQKEQTLIGVYGCRYRDMEQALVMLSTGQLLVDDLLSRRIGLDDLPAELAHQLEYDEYKVVMVNQ
jgi:threonine dehydrogenase-like Zn-dependent dehydrogenase